MDDTIVRPHPDLRRLREDIERLRQCAEDAGYGPMGFFLTCARILADRQIRLVEEDDADTAAEGKVLINH